MTSSRNNKWHFEKNCFDFRQHFSWEFFPISISMKVLTSFLAMSKQNYSNPPVYVMSVKQRLLSVADIVKYVIKGNVF